MSKGRPKPPLLVTRCTLCYRRRACAPIGSGTFCLWLCRACILRVVRAGMRASVEFKRQGR
jgi:hypothetical protein